MRIRQLLEEVRINRLPASSFTGSGWKARRIRGLRWYEVLLV
jgi:hypothetical protein